MSTRSRLSQFPNTTPPPSGPAWLVTGNTGAGKLLGTLTNDLWSIIVNGITRGTWRTDGGRTLSSHGVAFANTELSELTVIGSTTNATPTLIYSLTLPDEHVWRFSAEVQARRSSGLDRGVYERKVMVYREGGGATLGKQHTTFTDESDAGYNLRWEVSGNDLNLMATGAAGQTVYWSGTVRYQGVQVTV